MPYFCYREEGSERRADGDYPVARRARTGEDGARHPGKSDGVLRERAEMKYAFIRCHRRVWPIVIQCRVLKVSVSGYHEHFARGLRIIAMAVIGDSRAGLCLSRAHVSRRLCAQGDSRTQAQKVL